MGAFVSASYSNFDNLFKFFHGAFNWLVSFYELQMLSGAFAFLFALPIGFCIYLFQSKKRVQCDGLDSENIDNLFMLTAMTLGSVYTCVFSPLNQNNGYITIAPVWLFILFGLKPFKVSWKNWIKMLMVGLFWYIISLGY